MKRKTKYDSKLFSQKWLKVKTENSFWNAENKKNETGKQNENWNVTKSQKVKNEKKSARFLKTVSRTQITETEVKNRFDLHMWNKLKNKKSQKIVRFLKTVSQKQKIENQTENEKEIVMCHKKNK